MSLKWYNSRSGDLLRLANGLKLDGDVLRSVHDNTIKEINYYQNILNKLPEVSLNTLCKQHILKKRFIGKGTYGEVNQIFTNESFNDST
jgi:hypothetical protein